MLWERQARAREGERSRADSDAATAPKAVHCAADGNLDGGTEEGAAHVDRGDGGSRQMKLRHYVVQHESDGAAHPEEGANAPHAQHEPHQPTVEAAWASRRVLVVDLPAIGAARGGCCWSLLSELHIAPSSFFDVFHVDGVERSFGGE